jgi:hypothetical protein
VLRISVDRRLRGTRFLGSVIGFYLVYGWEWYFWTEAHEYFMSPFALFLWVSSVICDFIYPYALWHIQKTEKVLPDGKKVRADSIDPQYDKRL